MRFVFAMLAVLGLVIGSAAASAPVAAEALTSDSGYALAAQPPTGQLDVEVDVGEGGGAWWASPMWIGIGIIALILLVLIIAMAARGGGTTVIKE